MSHKQGQRLELRSEAEMGLPLVDSQVTAVRIKLSMSPSLPPMFICHYSFSPNL